MFCMDRRQQREKMPDMQVERWGFGERTPLGVPARGLRLRRQQLAVVDQVIAGDDAVVLMPTSLTATDNHKLSRCRDPPLHLQQVCRKLPL
jgi:hypothetical protein